MNYTIIRRTTGLVLRFEALFLVLPALTGFIYRELAGAIYLILAVMYFLLGNLLNFSAGKDDSADYFTKEGFISVAMVWIVISMCGALPFVVCGDIPRYSDALFETVSGFTTTGSSILTDVEALSHASLFWRSFTHWVGGMGVIVLVLAIMPMRSRRMGSQMHLMRAESPGPVVGKLVPKIRDTAKILYMLYLGITVTEIVLLLIAGMPLFDTLCLSFGTAGTGGFGVLGDSIASYPVLQQAIITVFMILFGVNFNAYFFIFFGKDKKEAFRLTEVRWYFAIIAFAIVTITINIRGLFDNIFMAFHHAAFQVRPVASVFQVPPGHHHVHRSLRRQHRRRDQGFPYRYPAQGFRQGDPPLPAPQERYDGPDGQQAGGTGDRQVCHHVCGYLCRHFHHFRTRRHLL